MRPNKSLHLWIVVRKKVSQMGSFYEVMLRKTNLWSLNPQMNLHLADFGVHAFQKHCFCSNVLFAC